MKRALTLTKKLTFILVAFFISMLLIVFALLFRLRGEYEESVYTINGENTSNILSKADSVFSSALLLSDMIVTEDFFQSNLGAMKDESDEDILEGIEGDILARLSTFQDSYTFLSDISLVTANGSIIHFGEGVGLSSQAIEEASALARSEEGASLWIGSDDGSIYLIRVIRRLEFLSLDELAVLFLRIDTKSLVASLRSTSQNFGTNLLLSYGDRLLYSEFSEIPDDDAVAFSVDSVPCFIYRGTLPESGFSYIAAVPRASLYNGMVESVVEAFAFLLLILILFLLFLHHIVKRMISRINALKDKMDAFESGQSFSDIEALPGTDEIAGLNERFDSMAKRYKEVVEDNYNRQIMLKDSAIRMLTQQINPHFLYNVLDSIYWLSQKYDADDIAAMSYSLASLFRAAVSSEDLVTLRKELELLKSFLDIQRSRFPDQISYKVDANDALMNVLLPKFSLQPLVENAVKHSIEEHGGSTEIEVKCSRCDNGVLFEVSNTGSQFPSDLQEKLRKGTVSSSSERIGLQNIDERLHLLFGDGSGLGFRNENGRAIVSFYVPWREDADSDSGR